MAVLSQRHPASGGPGIEPRWTRSDKHGVGTAYAAWSRVWFTVSKGLLNEVYYPTIDRPQIRDLQYLVSDGETFFRDDANWTTPMNVWPLTRSVIVSPMSISRGTSVSPRRLSNPHRPCVLLHTRLEASSEVLAKLRLFALLAPHLEIGGRSINGESHWLIEDSLRVVNAVLRVDTMRTSSRLSAKAATAKTTSTSANWPTHLRRAGATAS